MAVYGVKAIILLLHPDYHNLAAYAPSVEGFLFLKMGLVENVKIFSVLGPGSGWRQEFIVQLNQRWQGPCIRHLLCLPPQSAFPSVMPAGT